MSLFRFITLILIALVASCSSTPKVTSPTGQAPLEVLELSVEEEVSIDAANIAKEHGDYDEALKLFKEVLETNPVATDAYVGMGDIYLAKQDWSQAEPAFARAAKLEPRDFDDFSSRIEIYLSNILTCDKSSKCTSFVYIRANVALIHLAFFLTLFTF